MVLKKKESNTQNNSSKIYKRKFLFSLMMMYWNQRNPHLIGERITKENIKLAKVVQIYFTIQATSESSERLFSKAGLVITNR